MADSTIIQQGKFTSDGTAVNIALRSDVDWMEVINYTQMATQQGTGRGVKFYWQRGLAAGYAFETTKADSTDALQGEIATTGGFTLLDQSSLSLGAAVTGTTITKADPPVCTANGHGYSDGDIVVMNTMTEMDQLATVYWTIGSTTTNTFELTYMDTNTSNFTAESAFTVRRVPKFSNWVPPNVIISNITAASQAVVTCSADVSSYFAAGDVVRITCPSVFGMSEIDGLTGEIQSVSSNTYTLDIDSSAFTAFAWPDDTSLPFSYPQMVPVGTNSSSSLLDATDNTAILGMSLGAGIDGPAGSSSDVIYWRAGKSFAVDNQ